MVRTVAKRVKVGPFVFSSNGVRLTDEPTAAEWRRAGRHIRRRISTSMWHLGDWCNFAEHTWGQKYKLAAAVTGLTEKTLRNVSTVCEAFSNLSRRRDKLTFAHHAEVAALSPEIADELLDLAEREKLSRGRLRALARERLQLPPEPPAQDKDAAVQAALSGELSDEARSKLDGAEAEPVTTPTPTPTPTSIVPVAADPAEEARRYMERLCVAGGPVAGRISAACRRLSYAEPAWWEVLRVAIGLEQMPAVRNRNAPWDRSPA